MRFAESVFGIVRSTIDQLSTIRLKIGEDAGLAGFLT